MLDGGSLLVALAVQFTLVSLVFMRALQRSGRQRRERPLRRPAAQIQTTPQPFDGPLPRGLDDLAAQRAILQSEIAQIRSDQAQEEAAFRSRRSEVLLQLHEYQRRALELAAAEPALLDRVEALRHEVEHLDRRRPELAEEIRASTRMSMILRERLALARRELRELRRDRERMHECLQRDTEHLNDLARRRALLYAETEELSMLARTLQQAGGGLPLLSQLTESVFDEGARHYPVRLRTTRLRPSLALRSRSVAADLT